MPASLAVASKSRECRKRLLLGGGNRPDSRQPGNSPTPCSASSTLAFRLWQIPRAASKIAIGEVMGDRTLSSISPSASASGSRVRIATMADASMKLEVPAQFIIERLDRVQAGSRPAQYPLLSGPRRSRSGTASSRRRNSSSNATLTVSVLFMRLQTVSLSASWLTISLRILRGMSGFCVDVRRSKMSRCGESSSPAHKLRAGRTSRGGRLGSPTLRERTRTPFSSTFPVKRIIYCFFSTNMLALTVSLVGDLSS
jgi:hypothetical protein